MLVRVIASSSTMTGVVTVGSTASDSLGKPDNSCSVIFEDAKGRSDDGLDGFDSDDDGDEEQKP